MGRYLVTGGAGFIGGHIVKALIAQGASVRVLDNFATGKRETLDAFENQVEVIEDDLRSLAAVEHAVDGVDFVLHEGALPSVPRSIDDPSTTNDVNVTGTLNLLVAARDADVKRVVFASSSSVYGNSPKLPKDESMTPNPLSPYAVSKLAGETYCRVFNETYGLETVVLRYFNVFGPRQDPKSQYSAVIPKFLRLMRSGQPPTVFGDGEQSRDFTHIDNVVDANLKACEAPASAAGEVFNCACHDQVTLNQLLDQLNGELGTSLEAEYAPDRAGDVRHSYADINKAKELLGYRPSVSFSQGLARLVAATEI